MSTDLLGIMSQNRCNPAAQRLLTIRVGALIAIATCFPASLAIAQSALSFNGTNQYVTMGGTSSLNGSSFTVECWFRRDGAGTPASTGSGGLATALPLVSKGAAEAESPANLNANYILVLSFSSPNYFLAADFEDTSGGVNHPLVGSTPLAASTWYHAALVSSVSGGNTTLTLYLNGAVEATTTFNGVVPESTSTQHFAIATTLQSNGTTAAGFFAGVIDEVRMWNIARTQGEIQGAMNLPLTSGSGLVGRWGLNEGAGLDVLDSVGPAQNGVLVNGPTRTSAANAAPALVAAGETTVVFRQETGVYTDAVDTTLSAAATGTAQNTVNNITIDGGGDGATNERHALLRFNNIYGMNPGQIPPGAQIQSACLTTFVTNATANSTTIHRMLQDWPATATWSSLVGGVQANGIEAATSPDITLPLFATAVNQSRSADVSLSLQAWQSNPSTNYGWAWLPGGNDGLVFDSAEGATVANRPRLSVTFLATPNLPPSQPTLISPVDMAIGISTSPSLTVNVSDPEMTPLNVSFYGREAAAPVGADFTIVAIPDTQYYACNNGSGCPAVTPSGSALYNGQTQWIVNNRVSKNIAFVAHLGDCVEHGDSGNGSPDPNAEWLIADAALSLLENPVTTMLAEGIPYGVAVGNHDQTPLGVPRSGGDEGATTVRYNNFFGLSRFAGRSYYGGRYDFGNPGLYPNNNDNHYQLFSVSGLDFIAISLEWDDVNNATRQAVLAWANTLLQTYSNRRAIVYAHTLINTGNPGSFANQGQATYDALKANANLFLMLCGHVPGEGQRLDTFGGHSTYTLLSDYQGRSNGGDGWLRLLEFSPASNEIRVKTFSPTRNGGAGEFETDSDSQFILSYDMGGGAPPFNLISASNGVASGSNATVVWPGLDANKTYEWYAIVSDGVNSVTGPTWTFTTTCTTNADCEDDNPCTDDVCNMGMCEHTNNMDACDDGDLCTSADTCSGGECAGTPVSCPMGQACNPADGMCVSMPITVTFRNGLNSYNSTADTFIRQQNVNQNNGSTEDLRWDTEENGVNTPQYSLLRFDDIFGAAQDQIPPGSTISSAMLTYTVGGDSGAVGDNGELHESLVVWDEATVTYANFGGDTGVQSDEYAAAVVATLTAATTSSFTVDVTSSLVAWSANPAANLGWIVIPTNTNGVQVRSSDYLATPAERPTLMVTYTGPAGCKDDGDCDDENPCTDDVCNMEVCEHTNNTVSCDDGDMCTTGDACSGGSCSGNPVTCPMGQSCNSSTGMCELQPVTLMFQEGLGGYANTVDTFLEQAAPTIDNSAAASLTVDLSPLRQILLRFDGVFGNGVNQIPIGSTIQSATLTINVTNESVSAGALLHRMLQSWNETDNWNTFGGNGIQANDVEAVSTADVSSASGVTLHSIDVTPSLVAWSAGAANFGWALLPPAIDNSWVFDSSEGATPPKLSVTFLPVSQCATPQDCDDLNPCTDDSCNMGVCVNTNNSDACDDGDVCTDNDTCSGGSCAGSPIAGCCTSTGECDDSNPCTDDDCVNNVCEYTNNSDDCDDGDPCTDQDACSAGTCAGTPIAECCDDDGDCDDKNPCTDDECSTGNAAALSFDGTDDYVTMGPAPGLNTTTFTVECWLKKTGAGTPNTTGTGGIASLIPLVTKGAPEGDSPANLNANYILGIDSSTNTLAVDFEESGGANHPAIAPTVPAGNVIALNTWYHAAATFDGTTWRLYLNGSLILTQVENATPEANSLGKFALATMHGSNNTTYGRFAGVLDEVRVWNLARSELEIQSDMNAEISTAAGLMGRWGLDEGSGTTAGDSTSPAENGVLTSGPTWISMDLPDVGGGGCTHTPIPGCCNDDMDCDDGDACTQDYCVDNACQHDQIPSCCNNSGECDDSNPCTDDACVNNACAYIDNSDACDDGDSCTSDDTCAGGNCAGTPIAECCDDDGDCDDSNPCTDDFCSTPNSAALVLDGANDYITMGPALGLNASNFTIECWFRRDGAGIQTSTGTGGLTTVVPLVTKGRGEAETPAELNMNYFLGLSVSGGNYVLAADFEDTATGLNHPIAGSATIGTGLWHHAAATYDGSTWQLYLDGALEGTLVVGGFTPEATSIQHFGIGSAMTSSGVAAGYFQGAIDEVRVWNLVRTQSEIQASMSTELSSAAGLLGRWGLNEGTGIVAVDSASTPSAEDGTLTNGPIWITSDLPNLGSGGCIHLPIEGCCVSAGDCDDTDTCTTDDCVDNACEHAPVPNCCHDSSECDDNDSCTLDECLNDVCTHMPIPDCCSDSGDCDDGDPCTADACDVQNISAAVFDGADDQISFGAAASHTELGLSRFTVECWFNWFGGGSTTFTGGGTGGSQAGLRVIGLPLVSKGRGEADGDNRDLNYFLGIATDVGGGVLAGDFETDPGGANNAVIGATTITQNVWHHAALTYDGTAMRVYLDGMLDGTFSTTSEPRDDSIQPFGIATAYTSTLAAEGFFAGRIDEVRVWNYERTGQEIIDSRNLRIQSAVGLVGRWGFDEATGSAALDSSGNANDGMLSGATWSLSDLPDLGPGSCLHTPLPMPVADAGGDLVLCPSAPNPTVGGMPTASNGSPPYSYAWTGSGASLLDDPASPNPTFNLGLAVPGTYDLCVTVSDAVSCIGMEDCMSITVGGCITANLDIQGLVSGPVTRSVQFDIMSCPGGTESRMVSVDFTPDLMNGVGAGTVVLKEINPFAQWLAVREGHTLRRVASVDLSSGNEDSVNFADETSLVPGDFQTATIAQDDIIDIIDFAILAARYGTAVSDCESGDPADCSLGADVNGDGAQETVDFTALQINFFKVSDALQSCAPAAPQPGRKLEPLVNAQMEASSAMPRADGLPVGRRSITISSLRVLLPVADLADRNGDQIVDIRDVVRFGDEHGLQVEPRLRQMSQELQQQQAPIRRR